MYFRITRYAVSPLMVAVAFSIFVLRSEGRAADPIVGAWLREGDEYQGWVIEVTESGTGALEAKSLFVPGPPRLLNGFQIGEKKILRIQPLVHGEYRCSCLSRSDNGTSYDPSEISITGKDRMIILSDEPSGRIGDKQKWRKLRPRETANAYAHYGRAKIAADKERYAGAVASLKLAVNCLLLDDTPGAHKELANEIAWWLATSHIDEIRSPSLAMFLEPKLGDWWEHVDTQAAIHAANGNYEKAVELQEQAITLLKADDADAVFLENNGLDGKNGVLRLVMLVRGHSPQARLSDFQNRKVLYQKRRPYLDVVENEATAATTDDERG